MKFILRSFRLPKHMSYEFKPRYYDERKEHIEGVKAKYEATESSDKKEKIKLRLQSSFQRRFEEQRKGVTYSSRQSSIRVLIIFAILSIFTAYLILRFLPQLNALLR